MRFLDRMERKLGWLAFPGFLRYYAVLHLVIFAMQFFKPGLSTVLEFDPEAIQSGQVWRLVTFLFSSSGMLCSSPLTILFFIFGVMLMFTISDSLEGAWGSFRTTVFYLVGWLSLLGANYLFGGAVPFSGLTFYSSVFFAFATLFPRYPLSLFMIIPVPVFILAIIMALGMVFFIIQAPVMAVFYAIALTNYFLWCGVPTFLGQKLAMESAQRRGRFNAKKLPKGEAFHTCATCGRTEVSDPALEFRIGADGQEYCDEHLPK